MLGNDSQVHINNSILYNHVAIKCVNDFSAYCEDDALTRNRRELIIKRILRFIKRRSVATQKELDDLYKPPKFSIESRCAFLLQARGVRASIAYFVYSFSFLVFIFLALVIVGGGGDGGVDHGISR